MDTYIDPQGTAHRVSTIQFDELVLHCNRGEDISQGWIRDPEADEDGNDATCPDCEDRPDICGACGNAGDYKNDGWAASDYCGDCRWADWERGI